MLLPASITSTVELGDDVRLGIKLQGLLGSKQHTPILVRSIFVSSEIPTTHTISLTSSSIADLNLLISSLILSRYS
ncbi:MAG: hypothetical protein E6L01_01610 [Thaumarchaeota archaeon]|nr:MAG: hypothetical protein E6L01_01610 [Nitrososphaerota archaeon]